MVGFGAALVVLPVVDLASFATLGFASALSRLCRVVTVEAEAFPDLNASFTLSA